jgi:hypothetical protein
VVDSNTKVVCQCDVPQPCIRTRESQRCPQNIGETHLSCNITAQSAVINWAQSSNSLVTEVISELLDRAQGVACGVVKTYGDVFLKQGRARGDGNYIPRKLEETPDSGCENSRSLECGPWDTNRKINAKIECARALHCFHSKLHLLTTAHCANVARVTLCLFHFHVRAQGSVGRGEMESPCSQLSRSAPLFPSSLISGTPAWGVLDYAIHTFISLFFVSRILLVSKI